MNTIDELLDLPLTDLELLLKNYIALHPKWKNRLLSSTEFLTFLDEFNRYMLDTESLALPALFGNKADRWSSSGGVFPFRDAQFYACQTEGSFIPSDFDISVGRMLRYMPSHWHTNDYFELYYVFSGSCQLCFENETVEMKPGTIFLLSPSTLHASPCYSDDCALFYYMIRTSTFNMVFWNNLAKQNLMSSFFQKVLSGENGTSYLHFETGGDETIRSILYEIYQEYASCSPYSPQLMNYLMGVFFMRLLRSYETNVILPADHNFHWKSSFAEIFSYIQNNYDTVTLKELSERFHYSERQLARIIRNCTNSTFSDFILSLRMNHAASYLTNTTLTSEVISAKVGYENSSSFHRAFVKFYGYSPKEYREHLLKPRFSYNDLG